MYAQDLKFTKCGIKMSPPSFREAASDNGSLKTLYYYPHFPDGKTEAWTSQATCPMPFHHSVGLYITPEIPVSSQQSKDVQWGLSKL